MFGKQKKTSGAAGLTGTICTEGGGNGCRGLEEGLDLKWAANAGYLLVGGRRRASNPPVVALEARPPVNVGEARCSGEGWVPPAGAR